MASFGRLLFYQLIGCLVAFLFFAIPSPLAPVLWAKPFPLPPLPTPNSKLANAHQLAVNIAIGPESLAMTPNGDVFTGLSDGRVILLDKVGNVKQTVYFKGAIMKNQGLVFEDGRKFEDAAIKIAECSSGARAKTLQWSVNDERDCGRPLGMRYIASSKRLYVVDAYSGIYCISLDGKNTPKSIKHLVSPAMVLAAPSQDKNALLPPKFFNDLDVSPDEKFIYYTDSSYRNHRAQNRPEVLDGAPRGRFFQYDVQKKAVRLILCGLHFPNGVQIHHGSEVLVVDSARFRILKVDIKKLDIEAENLLAFCGENGSLRRYLDAAANHTAPESRAVTVFYDQAPGFLDNIRVLKTKGTTEYLVGVAFKSTKPFSLLHYAYRNVLLRHAIGRLVSMKMVEHLAPKFGMILKLDEDGRLVESYQDPKGGVAMVSEAQVNPTTGDMWIGSHSNPFLARLYANEL